MRTCVVAVVTVTLGTGLAACSSDDGGESSTPDVCASADAFRGSLGELRDVQVVQEGTDALDSAWTTVDDAWTQLAADAKAEYGDQVDGVQAAADDVRAALDDAQDQRSAQTLGSAATAVGTFLQDADALADEVDSTC
jgi:hypothetical protein